MNPMPFFKPWIGTLARVFDTAGAPLYAVGGAVRNALMGLTATDLDVCGPARPERVLALCEGTPVRAVLRAAHFGTVELHVADADGRHMAEYTTFRVDSYRCGHQPSAVQFADTPQVDALRRDFSVNALYQQLHETPTPPAEVIDPTGGLTHLRQGVLHTVTKNPDQVLKDDGLRILRAARFQAELGLVPTEALLASAAKYAPLLLDIAMERLKDELSKLLLADTRYPALARTVPPVAAGLATLLRVGAWPALFGNMQPSANAIAAMRYYQAPQGVPPVAGKLALLFWAEAPLTLAARMRALRYAVHETAAAEAALNATLMVSARLMALMDAVRIGSATVAHAVAAFSALHAAGEPCEAALAQAQSYQVALADPAIPLSLKALALRGDDLLALCTAVSAPVQTIGPTLDRLWQATVERRVPNERAALLAAAAEMLKQQGR